MGRTQSWEGSGGPGGVDGGVGGGWDLKSLYSGVRLTKNP